MSLVTPINGFLREPDRDFKQGFSLIRRALSRGKSVERASLGFPLPFRFVVDMEEDAVVFYAASRSGDPAGQVGRLPFADIADVSVESDEPLPACKVRRVGEEKALGLVLGMTAADARRNANQFVDVIRRRKGDVDGARQP